MPFQERSHYFSYTQSVDLNDKKSGHAWRVKMNLILLAAGTFQSNHVILERLEYSLDCIISPRCSGPDRNSVNI
jgi:hypothetical protein